MTSRCPPDEVPLCVDGRMLDAQGTGVTTYGRNVVSAARSTGRAVSILRDVASPSDRIGKWVAAATGRVRRTYRGVDPFGRGAALLGRHLFGAAALHFSLYRRLLRIGGGAGEGVMHWTYPIPARVDGWANIYTVHDLIPIDAPDLSPVDGHRLAAIVRRIAQHADCIVTVSEASRRSILTFLELSPERVVNCSQSAAPETAEPGPSELPAGLSPGGYFLHCGTLERRKNLGRLCEAHRRSGTSLPLVLVGPDGWRPDEAMLLSVGSKDVIRMPYCPAVTIRALVHNARALCMPSLAEGFGLPVLEAMIAGAPALTSDRGALAELAGDAALLVDPFDIDAMAHALRRLTQEDLLCSELRNRGLARAKQYGLAQFALRLNQVYTQAIVARRRAKGDR